jgi:hypothetical protein
VSARTRTLLPLFLAAGLVVAAGCKTRPYPIKFNNDMARAVDKLNKAGRDFYFAVLPLSKGAEVDPKEVRSKYQAVEKTLKEIKENYEEIGPPMGTTSGSELMDRFTDFLDGQQTLLDKYLTPILQKVEDNRLNPEDKWAAIKPLLDKMDDEEKQTRAPLEDVQKKWGEEHHLRLDK